MNKLKFLGAAQNVTGSRHLLQTPDTNILVDCGLYQERQFLKRNWEKFPVPPETISAVLLTHAHLDHCGYLPKLFKEGFRGRIYCTPATIQLTRLILMDSARIQEEDAEQKRKRHRKEGREGKPYPEVPLYTTEDAEACCKLLTPVAYNQCVMLDHRIRACFYNAGHVLGSAFIQVGFDTEEGENTILFTGDMGRPNSPIIQDPDLFQKADYLLVESTYGDRTHEPVSNIYQTLEEVINTTYRSRGNIVIPSFALERSQEILYHLNKLYLNNAIPSLRVYVDSPMASRITEVFKEHPELFDSEMTKLVGVGYSPFNLPGLIFAGSREESKKIQQERDPVIIIAGSGMCTGGRIKYHLIHNIERPESTILFVGYQANGTLGRQILDKNPQVRIHGQFYSVNARVLRVAGFSAHADSQEILRWLKNFQSSPRAVFLVHGESESAMKFRDFLVQQTGWKVYVPQYQEEIELS